jgi:DNA repair exonuclease SbcCD ATPase subunit
MFKKITLKNFRKHTDTVLDFQTGMNVIRGAVEQGKSTIMEATAYALFGSRALLDTLELVVTYGQALGTLKVTLDFTLNGTDYTITRGKNGAELFVAGVLTVTGQTEVTKFAESLLGCNADSASKLMLANQASLRGALADGPTAAMNLIETLANFDIINTFVDLIQNKLPTGSTAVTEARIVQLEEQTAMPLEDTTEDLKGEVFIAGGASQDADIACTKATQSVQDAQGMYDEAVANKQRFAQAQEALTRAESALAKAIATTSVLIPDEVSDESIVALEQQITDRSKLTAALDAKTKLDNLPKGDEWEGAADSLEANTLEAASVLSLVTDSQAAAKLALVKLRAQLITETHCAFCDKDLTEVPEVIVRNSKLAPAIEQHEKELADCADQLPTLKQGLADLQAVRRHADKVQTVYAACAGFIALDTGFVPARYTWTGPDLSVEATPLTNLTRDLAHLKAQIAARQSALGRLQQAQEQAKEVAEAVETAKAVLVAAEAAAEPSDSVIGMYQALCAEATKLSAVAASAQADYREAETALKHAQEMHAVKLKARADLVAQLAEAKVTLASMHFNNALIKKLRLARPQVVDKLWNMVLATVSKYFSSIRGIPSRVTRSDKGFLVNGHQVGGGGLSGSALDSLGLAIRIALTKTFLPNTRFLVLDEASAACNEEREANMAGCVAAADFDQVIWVTHSDAIEAFANHVIQL